MQPFTTLHGPAAVLAMDNVDTDVIIRIERLTTLGRAELGPYALESLRLRADGSEDPGCVLNQAPFREAPILVTGRNFGCGSSREGAVWALVARGIRCVIAESFGDIFFSNCFQNGLLPIRLPPQAIERIAAHCRDGAPLTVDLRTRRITLSAAVGLDFDVDAMRREALLAGLDDIGRTLTFDRAISAWQAKDRLTRPWAWQPAAHSPETHPECT